MEARHKLSGDIPLRFKFEQDSNAEIRRDLKAKLVSGKTSNNGQSQTTRTRQPQMSGSARFGVAELIGFGAAEIAAISLVFSCCSGVRETAGSGLAELGAQTTSFRRPMPTVFMVLNVFRTGGFPQYETTFGRVQTFSDLAPHCYYQLMGSPTAVTTEQETPTLLKLLDDLKAAAKATRISKNASASNLPSQWAPVARGLMMVQNMQDLDLLPTNNHIFFLDISSLFG
ncbi:hypothetical protein DFH06DRAFT_1139043 [Mycena polygramma]|nr:hypothetical protein DFH06DRAFT_1139043 [Mycena polygramma]